MNLYIYSEISEEQKEKVKNITPDTTIVIREANEEETIKILDTLLQLGIKSNIELTADDKEKFNHTKMFKDDKYDKLNIIIKGPQINSIKLTEYKYYENILYRFIEPAQNKNYSPFEKYIYAYNVTKRFKKYKESENRAESRDLYKLLESDYIVCAGYSNLLIDLLTKLGIPARFAKLTVATVKEGEETKNEYHARVAYSMKDPKYNIDGYYIADPTWDNSEEQDYYNFVALTSKEMNYGNRLIASKINEIYYNADELLFSETEQEFTDKVIEEVNKKEEPVVFIFWGNYARAKKVLITNPKHLVLESAHPSPFSAYNGFFGSRPFSKTNEFLVANGIKPIDWNIEKDL